ncbi:MAG: ArsR family transcriptional regulator [Promethearchaeota archaeon]
MSPGNVEGNIDDTFNKLSSLIQTMSSVERLKMLLYLGERDRSVKEIQKIIGKKGGSLYHHINALMNEGLILKIGSNYGLSEQGREALILLGLMAQEAMFLSSFNSEE